MQNGTAKAGKAVSGLSGQNEMDLKIKQTPLGRACNKWLKTKAGIKKLQEQNQAEAVSVLEEMRKENRNRITIDNDTFIRKITPESVKLEVKAN